MLPPSVRQLLATTLLRLRLALGSKGQEKERHERQHSIDTETARNSLHTACNEEACMHTGCLHVIP